jgi:hypothetical protein
LARISLIDGNLKQKENADGSKGERKRSNGREWEKMEPKITKI